MDNLEDVLNGSEPVSTAAPEVEVETPEPIAADPSQPRDEHGRFAPKGDNQPAEAQEPPPVAAPPAAETEPNVPIKALQEERRKRQELEQRLEAFERQQSQPQVQQPVQQVRPPSPLEAPVPQVFEDEYAQSIFEEAVAHVRRELGSTIQQQATTTQIEMQRLRMSQQHSDFLDVEKSFFELAQGNPVLLQEAQRSGDPVRWAYDYAKKAQEVQKIGSLDIEAIKQAAIQEYLQTQAPAPAPVAPQHIPTSLADAQSARSHAAPMAPPSLDSILGRK